MATRGCPYGCSYCVNFTFNKMFNNRKIRKRSIENILNELIEARKKMPYISHIYFLDDSLFLLSIEEISKLARGIKNEIGLPFGVCGATPATLKEEKLREIVDAGCNHISMGVQTGSARVMKMYLRPFSNEKILGAVKLLNQFRDKILAPQYDMILDNPWETEEDVIESLMLLSRFPVPYRLQLFSLTLYPGTGLSDKAKKEGMLKGVYEIDYSKNYREFWKNNLNSIFGLVSDCAVRGIKINPRIMAWLVSKKLRNLKLNWVIFYAIRLWVFIWKIANLPIGLWIVLREVFRDIAKGDWSRLKWFSRRERWRSIIHYVLDDRRKL